MFQSWIVGPSGMESGPSLARIDLSLYRTQAKDATGEILMLEFYQPDEGERQFLLETATMDAHDLSSSLDADEVGRFDLWEGGLVMILKTPKNHSSKDRLFFKVNSLGLHSFPGLLILVSDREASVLEDMRSRPPRNKAEAILRVLASTVSHFQGHIRVLGMLGDAMESRATSSMDNESLLDMFKIEKSLVYYLNALGSDMMLMEKLKSHTRKLEWSEEQIDRLEDCIIDLQQCDKQARMQADIMETLMSTRSSIMNNNMNVLIKRLTIVNVIFLPLNLLAGMGGMSEYTAMTDGLPLAIRWGIFAVALVGMGSLTWLLIRRYLGDQAGHRKKPKHNDPVD